MSGLELHSKIESLRNLEDYVLQELEHFQLSADLIQDIRLVVEEIFSNIVSHGYHGADGKIRVRAFVDHGNRLCIQFRDWGSPFNPLERDPPNLEQDFADREIGGLGIHLVKQLAHNIHYAREDDSNILTVCFRS
jgi:anti-sigma regulatory factor (Ser/Thr protein kinase)